LCLCAVNSSNFLSKISQLCPYTRSLTSSIHRIHTSILTVYDVGPCPCPFRSGVQKLIIIYILSCWYMASFRKCARIHTTNVNPRLDQKLSSKSGDPIHVDYLQATGAEFFADVAVSKAIMLLLSDFSDPTPQYLTGLIHVASFSAS